MTTITQTGELKDFVGSISKFGQDLIVCCDPGTDDILMLAQTNILGKNILGIIPCAGNTDLKFAINNVLLLNEMTERRQIKVFPGSNKPSQSTKEIETATHVFGAEGLANLKLPDPMLSGEQLNGVDFAINAIENAETPITIISTGGLTDVAKILQEVSLKSLHKKIAAISIMGGVLDLKQANAPLSALKEGKQRWAEFNIIYDPTSSKTVFKIAEKLNIPILLSTLDLTHSITYKKEQVKSLRKVDNYVAKILSDLIGDVPTPYLIRFGKEEPQQPAHDLNASMAVFYPHLYLYERGNLHVDGEDSTSLGKTTFKPHLNGNVFVLSLLEKRKDQFFSQFEKDLHLYDSPMSCIRGYLYDIRNESAIEKGVELVNKKLEQYSLLELDLASLLITSEIASALIEIVIANPKLNHITMSLPKKLSDEISQKIQTIEEIIKHNTMSN